MYMSRVPRSCRCLCVNITLYCYSRQVLNVVDLLTAVFLWDIYPLIIQCHLQLTALADDVTPAHACQK